MAAAGARVSGDPQVEAETLRGILRVTVGGEERLVRKLKLRPAEEWFERNAKALGPIAHVDASTIEGDPEAFAGYMRDVTSSLLAAIADYDTEGTLGGVEDLANTAYPDEIAPLFWELRDAALPFVGLLRDRRVPRRSVGSALPSSTNGHSPTGGSTPTPSATGSTPGS